ncbi:MAG: hypothetical protein CL996_06390 [Euryarchaeota archaeon]|nr:hypothetical protein [Euryarchaeota archaeon]
MIYRCPESDARTSSPFTDILSCNSPFGLMSNTISAPSSISHATSVSAILDSGPSIPTNQVCLPVPSTDNGILISLSSVTGISASNLVSMGMFPKISNS